MKPRYVIPIVIALTAIIIVVLALALTRARNTPSRAQQCVASGGTVTTETERKKVNGKWRTVTEHECIKDGVETDEW